MNVFDCLKYAGKIKRERSRDWQYSNNLLITLLHLHVDCCWNDTIKHADITRWMINIIFMLVQSGVMQGRLSFKYLSSHSLPSARHVLPSSPMTDPFGVNSKTMWISLALINIKVLKYNSHLRHSTFNLHIWYFLKFPKLTLIS